MGIFSKKSISFAKYYAIIFPEFEEYQRYMNLRVCFLYSVLLVAGSLLMALSVLSCASRPSPLPGDFEFPGGREREPEPPGAPEFPPEEAGGFPPIEEITADTGLLLAFDDDYADIWERYLDLFDRYGARVTFFVQGDYSPFCTVAENRGHEIGYHTKNHFNLLKVSRQVFLEETVGGAESFRQRGIPLKAFAYPYGYSEPWMDEVLWENFSILRGFGTTFRVYNADAIKAGYISSKSIDNNQYKNDAEFEADISDMLGSIKLSGGVLPLTTHTIAAEVSWGISPDRLEYLLKTAAELELKFYRYGDFF
jgi:peptidoglycan/xylan/chitin deacetylase (PgdA/CDA1 family)